MNQVCGRSFHTQFERITARKLSVRNLFLMREVGACVRPAAKFLLPYATFFVHFIIQYHLEISK